MVNTGPLRWLQNKGLSFLDTGFPFAMASSWAAAKTLPRLAWMPWVVGHVASWSCSGRSCTCSSGSSFCWCWWFPRSWCRCPCACRCRGWWRCFPRCRCWGYLLRKTVAVFELRCHGQEAVAMLGVWALGLQELLVLVHTVSHWQMEVHHLRSM